jgi:thymidylate synthase
MYKKYIGINEALVDLCKELLENSIPRTLQGFQSSTSSICNELPEPLTIEIQHPECRAILIPDRKWYPYLAISESLWLLLGFNNLDSLTGRYSSSKSIYRFAKDGHHWDGGYGPRIKGYTGISTLYRRGADNEHEPTQLANVEIDQLRYVVDLLIKEPTSRQAIINIDDTSKDTFDGNIDYPCTRFLHFMVVDGELNCYVHMRSNDLLRGFSAINIFNFTFMQKYISMLTNIPVGKYFHIADNFHFYESDREMITKIANTENPIQYDNIQLNSDDDYSLTHGDQDYDVFIHQINDLYKAVTDLYVKKDATILTELCDYYNLYSNNFLLDWMLALASHEKCYKPLIKEYTKYCNRSLILAIKNRLEV